MARKPLQGVKVVDLTYFIAGPGASRLLADWGADVIKVEPEFGDPCRSLGKSLGAPTNSREINPVYSTYNANKRGLSINLKDSEGIAILDRLLKTAKVFVTSFRTNALTRLGLDYETLSKRHPHLIWAQVNGFGDYGPAKDNAGFDTVAFWARSGAMMDLAEKDTSPVNPPYGFGDSSTSCSLAAGICAALYQQSLTGQGEKVMASLFSQAIWAASSEIASTQFNDEYPKTRKNATTPTVNSYKCKDGKWIFISMIEHERYFPVLCKLFHREDLLVEKYIPVENAKANAVELISILEKEFIKYTQDELVEMFTKADIANERIQHFKDVVADPQAVENNYVYDLINRNKQVTKIAMPPVKFGGIDTDPIKDAPLVGQDTVDILTELGYTAEEIEAFKNKKVISMEK
ncbi:MAG: CoA transferase [Fusobacteriaceae bacterium]|jgi:crotonobetainyl-CoA:carnitine CoA-transferase CaiB-like acyl-CoA transferase|nr:CoA transferase [Fusobacteriaceae bacterium]